MPPEIDHERLADHAYLGRLLSRVASEPHAAGEVLAGLPQPQLPPHRIGVTGSPGVGKSTLLRGMIKQLRHSGHRVGVVAVDPTSPFTGGAILGDRIRLAPQQDDEGVFIRSLGSRGSLGGVTPGASAVARVLECAGYDRILIETVGVGQTGYDVICLADTVIAMFSPEGGDGVQLLKAGILEVGDIFAVNKCDRPGADALLREIRTSLEIFTPTALDYLHHGRPSGPGNEAGSGETAQDCPGAGGEEVNPWRPPVVEVIAQDEQGIEELIRHIEAHRAWIGSLPAGSPHKRRRLARELAFVIRSKLSRLLERELAEEVDQLAKQVSLGHIELWSAVEKLEADTRDLL